MVRRLQPDEMTGTTLTSTSARDLMLAAMEANATDLLSYFRRRVTNPEDAADLLGETALTAWRRIEKLPADPEKARMWLFVTARHTAANFGRRTVHRFELSDSLRTLLRTQANRDPSESTGTALDVRRAVQRLAPRQREIVMLIHWDGFTVAETAEILQTSPSTVRARYGRASEQLRTELGAD